jgi:hypothetical protein
MHTETVTAYVANDGARFKTQEQCVEYETELHKVEPIISQLPRSNPPHGMYVQHDAEPLRRIRRLLWTLVLEKLGDEYPNWKLHVADDLAPFSVVDRVLDDYTGPLARAWKMLRFFDFATGREYDQPYFVLHPNEAMEWKRGG